MSIQIQDIKSEEDVRRYLSKIADLDGMGVPDEVKVMRIALENKMKLNPLGQSLLYLLPSPLTDNVLNTYISQDKESIELKHIIRKLAVEKDAVLIIGESGTGKDILARALHGGRQGSFVAVNCAAMPAELIESELFGHVSGAFTGAVGLKQGLIETAHNGTLFLDEIGDLPLAAQAKILRVLQDKKVRKVGGVEDKIVNVKIVCATHHNLMERVVQKEFRLDLYSRINTFTVVTKPIRNRRGDIPLIVNSLSSKAVNINKLIAETKWLQDYEYPSNVRDIQRFCRQYEVLGRIL